MKIILSFILTLYVSSVFSQTNQIEVVQGVEKYKDEVIEISRSYSKKTDSFQNDRIQMMNKDSSYSQNEIVDRPSKYKTFDGGMISFLMDEETKRMEEIVNRFLKIDRISSSYTKTMKGFTEYGFNYYRTIKDSNGSRTIQGVVIWINKSKP